MSKLLITGGLGHIGSKLIRHLPRHHDVTVIDNFYTQRYCSLFDVGFDIRLIECSFEETPVEIIEQSDVIIHLAAVTNASNSFNNSDIEEINITKTKKFIDTCNDNSDAKFIFPSSTSVYGVASDIVTEDDDSFLNPQSPYAESKIEIENYIKSKEIEYLILRLGTIFGNSTGMRFHTAINKFCYQAALGVPLTIWKQNYYQYRPYLGLIDCIKAVHFFLNNENYGQTFNVLTDNFILSDIIDCIKSITDVKLNLVDTPLLNQQSYKVSMNKLNSLGFIPQDNLKTMIESTIGKLQCVKSY